MHFQAGISGKPIAISLILLRLVSVTAPNDFIVSFTKIKINKVAESSCCLHPIPVFPSPVFAGKQSDAPKIAVTKTFRLQNITPH